MAKFSVEEFISAIKEMSVLELNELVKAIEEEFGVVLYEIEPFIEPDCSLIRFAHFKINRIYF